jgi:hypothetical protein
MLSAETKGGLRDSPMAMGNPADDPGWRPALRGIWWAMLIPGQLASQQRRASQAGVNGLTILRRVFVSFAFALALIGVVVVVLSSTTKLNSHPMSADAVLVAIAIIGAAALILPRNIERQLDCSDDGHLAGSYRTRFFLRVAFSQAVSLVGFAGFILTNAGWLYAVGAAFTAFGYCRLAPTAANLARDQVTLVETGCGRSLIRALAALPPSDPTGRRR